MRRSQSVVVQFVEKSSRFDETNSLHLDQIQEVSISGNDIVGATFEGCRHINVIIGIRCDDLQLDFSRNDVGHNAERTYPRFDFII